MMFRRYFFLQIEVATLMLFLIFTTSAVASSGSIGGIVRDHDGSLVGTGVNIRIFGPQGSEFGATNELGEYFVGNLDPGTYTIALSLNPPAEDLWFEGATVVEGETTGVDFDLSQGGTISGTVLSSEGIPVAGANLRTFRANPYGEPGYVVGFGITDGSGHYEIHGLDPGTYTTCLSLNYPAEDLCYEGASVVEGETTGVDFDLSQGGTISGTVLSSEGIPVAGANLRTFRANPYGEPGYVVGFGITDGSGHYEIHGLDPGTYTTCLSLNYPAEDLCYEGASVVEGETTGVDFDLSQGGTIVGTVLSAEDDPLADANLRAFRTDPSGQPGYVVGFAKTDTNGYYKMNGLDPGVYTVCMTTEPHGEADCREGLVVVQGETTIVNFNVPTDVDEEEFFTLIPIAFQLSQNYPNPFNPSTTIEYSISKGCRVNVTIFNVLGQRIRTLFDDYQPAGTRTVHWDGKDDDGSSIASGIYFYRIQAGEFTNTRKMIMLK